MAESLGKDLVIRTLQESDLAAADRLFRLAFGTFLKLPNPMDFYGDGDMIRTRWLADPSAAFGAFLGGELIGSNFGTNWGSVGFFGPLTVHPDFWDRGVAKRLLEPAMELFTKWVTTHEGLYTFAASPKHVALYQKFGFFPRFLTAVMSKPVDPGRETARFSKYSGVAATDRASCLNACRELTGEIYAGLDVQREIMAVETQRLGDTILLWDGSRLEGLAVCHCGPGTEAGSTVCFVKFAAVRPGPDADKTFGGLLESCEALAASEGLSRLVAGVNTGRQKAYLRMMAHGFQTNMQGVAMQRHNHPGYNRPEVYLVDDWR